MSSIISKIPHRWRLLFLGFFISFILAQCWLIATEPSKQRPIQPNNSKSGLKTEVNDDMFATQPLFGFDNFESKLPLIQRQDFTHLPDPYRQTQVKNAFLHAWNGYSMYIIRRKNL